MPPLPNQDTSAQLTPGALPAPTQSGVNFLQNGFNWVNQNIGKPIENYVSGLPITKLLQGNVSGAVNTAEQNLQNQNSLIQKGQAAWIKHSHGETLTPQEQADMNNYNKMTTMGVMGSVGSNITGGFRPVEEGEVLPNGYTTKFDLQTGKTWTNAPVSNPTVESNSFIRDMRYSQGNPNTPYRENPNPQEAKYSQETPSNPNPPSTPEEKAQFQENLSKPQQMDTSQWPEKPTETTTSSQKPIVQVGYNPIDEITASKASSSSKAYSVTTPQIQDAYTRNNITNPDQVYNVRQDLYDKVINPTLEQSTTKLPLGSIENNVDGIVPRIVKEMTEMDPNLSPEDSYSAAIKIINKLNNIARNEGQNMPTNLSLKDVLDYKTTLNQSTAVQNFRDGIRPTIPGDVATVATRNVLSNLMDTYAPSSISQAVKDYGLLEEGFPSYLEAYNNRPPSLGENIAKAGMGLGKKIALGLGVPIIGGGAIAAGTGIYQQHLLDEQNADQSASLKNGLQPLNNTVNQNTVKQTNGQNKQNTENNHNLPTSVTDIPQTVNDVNPIDNKGNFNATAPYELTTPDGKFMTMTPYQELQVQKKINAEKADPRYGQSTSYTNQVDQDSSNFNAYLTFAKPFQDQWNKTQALNLKLTQAMNLAKKISPWAANEIPFLGEVSSAAEGIYNPKWRTLSTLLSTIESEYPQVKGELTTAPTAAALQDSILQAAKQNNMDYYSLIQRSMGTNQTATSTTVPTNNTTVIPPPNIVTQPGMSYGGMGHGESNIKPINGLQNPGVSGLIPLPSQL